MTQNTNTLYKIVGPSLGYIFSDDVFDLLILGDYHTPVEKKDDCEENILYFLKNATQKHDINIYIEDALYIGKTTDLETNYVRQKQIACDEDTCSPIKPDEVETNGQKGTSLNGVNDFLMSCGRHDSMCPLERGRVHRIDIRAQTLVKVNDKIIQILDDRFVKTDPSTFVETMSLFVDNPNPQLIVLKTGLCCKVVKTVCDYVKQLDQNVKEKLFGWWKRQLKESYSPWKLNESFIFSTDYNKMWKEDQDRRHKLLSLIMTNSIMDLSTLCHMFMTGGFKSKSIVYVGCAHAEMIASFVEYYFGTTPKTAVENEFCLNPVKKHVHFLPDDVQKFT
jgi:hypothetical protein